MNRLNLIRSNLVIAGCLLATTTLASPDASTAYPHIPEPMVFDMMRPLGAKQGELEANVLTTTPWSGKDGNTHWAPEVEYTFADGLAIEFEFPAENSRLAEFKLGLQATFGTFNGGRSVHGAQYLGIYDRHKHRYSNSFVYTLGHRFNQRWSSMSMLGVSDLSLSSNDRNNPILNHALFYEATQSTTLGLEVNYLGGRDGHLLLMPQLHQKLTHNINLQLGVGLNRERSESAQPELGIRLIREF